MVDPIAFGPVVRQHNMVEVQGGGEMHNAWLGSKKRGRRKGRGHNPIIPFKRHIPSELKISHKFLLLKGSTTTQ
jgi:hypothetical protein